MHERKLAVARRLSVLSSLGGRLIWHCIPAWVGFHRYSGGGAVDSLIQGAGVRPPHLAVTACKYIGLYIIIMSANHSFRSLRSIHSRPSVTKPYIVS